MTTLALALVILAGFNRTPALEPAASFVAGKPVVVYCAATDQTWRAYLDAEYGPGASEANGSASISTSSARLSHRACDWLRKPGVPSYGLAASILVLTHEAIHLRGERDEGVTDCKAIHEIPRVAVKFFAVKPGKALRALMAAAWEYRAAETPPYRTVC